MFGLYITHPQVQIDAAVPVPQWGLSPLGQERAQRAASHPWAARLGRVLSSEETKARETAEILAGASGLDVEILPSSGENDRSATGFLDPAAFEAAADWFFAHPERSFEGWETAADAQRRIVTAVSRVLDRHDPTIPLAVIGHGGVGTLLKCHLAGQPISRAGDQPAGGGNLYVFSLSDRRLVSDWVAMESDAAAATLEALTGR